MSAQDIRTVFQDLSLNDSIMFVHAFLVNLAPYTHLVQHKSNKIVPLLETDDNTWINNSESVRGFILHSFAGGKSCHPVLLKLFLR